MGQLVIDHSQGQGLDGRQGRRVEYQTERCRHCESVIACLLVSRKAPALQLSNIDIAVATEFGRDLPSGYMHKYQCRRCGNVCRRCAAAMEADGGECPGPLEARIEHAIKHLTSIDDPTFRHDYGKTSHAAKGAGF